MEFKYYVYLIRIVMELWIYIDPCPGCLKIIPDLSLQSYRIVTLEEKTRVNVFLALYIEINQVSLHATTSIEDLHLWNVPKIVDPRINREL